MRAKLANAYARAGEDWLFPRELDLDRSVTRCGAAFSKRWAGSASGGDCRAPTSNLEVKPRPDAPGSSPHCRALLSDGTLAGTVAFAAATVGAATGLFFEPLADNEPHLVAMPKIIWRQAVTWGTAEGCTSCQRPGQR